MANSTEYKQYPSSELIFNAAQTKQILHYFYPENAARHEMDNIDYSSYQAKNLAQNMLVEAVNASKGISYVDRIYSLFGSPNVVTKLPSLAKVAIEAAKEGRFLFKDRDISDLKNLKIYDAARGAVAYKSRQKMVELANNQSVDFPPAEKTSSLKQKNNIAKNNINIYSSEKIQNLFNQCEQHCQDKIAELNMKWDAGMEKTVHAMTALAFKYDLKNIDSLSLSNDRKSISFADNNSGQKLHLSSSIAAETSIEQSQNNISKVSAERQNLSTNLAIPAKLRSLLADKNLSEQQLQNVAANVQVKTPNANYAAQDIAIKDGNLLVLYRNSECKEAAVDKEINLQQAIQTPAEQTLAQQNQQQQQATQTPNHDGPTPNHDGPTLKL